MRNVFPEVSRRDVLRLMPIFAEAQWRLLQIGVGKGQVLEASCNIYCESTRKAQREARLPANNDVERVLVSSLHCKAQYG